MAFFVKTTLPWAMSAKFNRSMNAKIDEDFTCTLVIFSLNKYFAAIVLLAKPAPPRFHEIFFSSCVKKFTIFHSITLTHNCNLWGFIMTELLVLRFKNPLNIRWCYTTGLTSKTDSETEALSWILDAWSLQCSRGLESQTETL